MITFPNAKINIGLNVVERRADSYHNLETVFYPIPLCDALEINRAEAFSFSAAGIPVDADVDNNLITKAFRLLQDEFQLPPVAVNFYKNIPFGAGLGGGSSDAAFTLKMLNEIFELQLTENQLEERAAKLGADCAFFVRNKPVFASGIGNVFKNITFSLKGFYITIIKPSVKVSTAEAYARICPQKSARNLAEDVCQLSVNEWKTAVKNDFESGVFAKHPLVGEIKRTLYAHGALYAAMSGSGSSVFGIFDKPADLKNVFPGHFVWNGDFS